MHQYYYLIILISNILPESAPDPKLLYIIRILFSVGKLQQVLSSTGASTQINEEDDGEISDEEISNLVKTISYPGRY